VFLGLGRLVLNLPFKLLVIFTTIGLVIGGIWGTLNLDQANQLLFSQTFHKTYALNLLKIFQINRDKYLKRSCNLDIF
jgi:hypothetical protein